jgi:tetratricopeptide (TPR) repeat protein
LPNTGSTGRFARGSASVSHSVRWPIRTIASSRIVIEQESVNRMRKVLLSLLAVLLAISLAGCLPSFDPEAEEHFYQGIEYTSQGNNDSAMDEFTKAIEIDPTYYFAYYNRALAYYRIGDLESSLMDYNKAVELQPDNVYWTIERGFLYMKLGDREKAIIDLERSQELGVPYEYSQRVEEALAQLKPK